MTQNRTARAQTTGERRGLLRFPKPEVVVALGFAGLVNLAIVMMSSSVFGKLTRVSNRSWRRVSHADSGARGRRKQAFFWSH